MLSGQSQDESEKKFTFSIRTGVAVSLYDGLSYTLIEAGVQGEYRFSERFTLYMPLQYHHVFYLGAGNFNQSVGTLGLMAGPRFYGRKRFFGGIGIGYALYLDESLYGSFAFQPHMGWNFKKTQLTFGYYSGVFEADTPGFMELKFAFKLGGRE
jgi:hypothetical protein